MAYYHYFTPLDRILNKIRRHGFFLYIAIVFGAVGWTFYDMHRISRSLKKKP